MLTFRRDNGPGIRGVCRRFATRVGGSAIDSRTTRHHGYEVSQRKRKRIEQCFGWGKAIGPIRQVMVKGLDNLTSFCR